jgi:hypothetical protein
MDEMKWELLLDVYDRLEAEMIKSALEAEGISAELFQEGAGRWAYPTTIGPLGHVQIFVPKDKAEEARQWLDAYQKGSLENKESDQNNRGKKP